MKKPEMYRRHHWKYSLENEILAVTNRVYLGEENQIGQSSKKEKSNKIYLHSGQLLMNVSLLVLVQKIVIFRDRKNRSDPSKNLKRILNV